MKELEDTKWYKMDKNQILKYTDRLEKIVDFDINKYTLNFVKRKDDTEVTENRL
jgi:hypothetical protein